MATDELEVAIAAPPTPTSPAPRSPAGGGIGCGGGNNAALMTQLLADVSQWAAQAAVSLHHCRDLHQALSTAGAGAVDQWAAADLDPLLARAQALVAQAVAWEDAAAARLPPALAALTRQRWAGLIRRVTERVRQAHEAGKATGGGGVGALLLLGGGGKDVVEEPAAAAADVVVSGGLARLEVSSPPGGVAAVRLHKQQPTQQPQQQQPNVLETWKGWYVQDGLRFSITATLFLTGTDRLCGYGSDALGDWTWEGEYVGTHQVVLRKQYVVGKATTTTSVTPAAAAAHKVQYMGTRAVAPDGGKQVMEGFWLALPGPTATGTFTLERQAESVATAHGHLWSGAWTTTTGTDAVSPTSTGPAGAIISSPKYASSYFTAPAPAAGAGEESQLWTGDTELVFTAHNRLFGLGSDRAGKFTVTGNYVEDGGGGGGGGGVKVTGLKLYQQHQAAAEYHGHGQTQAPQPPPPQQQSAVQFWGEIPAQAYSDLSRTRPVVMAGEWAGAADPAVQGTFHMQLEHLDVTATAGDDAAGGGGWTAAAAAVPAACASTTTTLGEVEWWEGWYNQFREQKQVAAQAFLMDGTRPCGVGLDSLGEWTWEGDFVDEDRLLLRKQYVNNPSYRIMYDGSRTTEAGDEVIRGRWGFAPADAAGDAYASAAAAFQPPHTQKFCLVKLPAASDAGVPLVLGCGQHWTGYREVMSGLGGGASGGTGGGGVVKPGADNLKAAAVASGGRAGGYHRVVDGGALVVASNHRIFGFGSDVHGTFTYLGKFGRYRDGRASVKLRMVKLYAPVPGPAGATAEQQPQPVQYRGQMDVRTVAAGSTVVQGSWATADGSSHGSFRWQAHHHLDLLDALQAAAAADLHHLLQHSPSSSPYEVVTK